MIIDSHIHVFNRTVAGADENFSLWPGNRWGAGESDILQQMDQAGIEKAFLISYTPVDVMMHYPPDKRNHMVAVFQHYDVRIQLAHYGTPRLRDREDPSGTIHYERLEEVITFMLAHPNLSCDLAVYQHLITPDEAYPYLRAMKVVEVLVKGVGADRIHWGTDWPYLGVQPYTELIRVIQEAPFLSTDEAKSILGGNAERFLGE